MWKAFQELRELGWLRTERLPRLIACQSDGRGADSRCGRSRRGREFAELFPNAHTIASGLRVPAAVGDFMMLDAIRESGGCARWPDAKGALWSGMKQAASLEGNLAVSGIRRLPGLP